LVKTLCSLNIFQKCKVFFLAGILALSSFTAFALAGEQPVAIFHAFDQAYIDVELYVCELSNHGYSHVQIAPAQKSNPSDQWWARYQPID
jgi:alpha-amylase